MPLTSDLIKNEKGKSEKIDQMCSRIKEASSKMVKVFDELLESAIIESSEVQLNFDKLNFTEPIDEIISSNKKITGYKNQTILASKIKIIPKSSFTVNKKPAFPPA